jgi:hypothetical protein
MIPISITIYNRPDYLQDVLNRLQVSIQYYYDNNKEHEDIILLPAVEPGCLDIKTIIEDIKFVKCVPTFHQQKMGCNNNTLYAIENAFTYSDIVLHLEDDLVPSIDWLVFILNLLNHYKNSNITYVASYNENHDKWEPYNLVKKNGFIAWGLGLWKDRWSWFKKNWILTQNNTISWDTHLNTQFVQQNKIGIMPVISRIKNIGKYNGTYMPTSTYISSRVDQSLWIDNIKLTKDIIYD